MKRKAMALILAISIIFTFAGCSNVELGFYNTIKSILNLQDINFEGTLVANIKTLDYVDPDPTDTDTTIADELTSIKQECSNSIVYNGDISVLSNQVSLNVGLKDSTGTVTSIVKILAIDKTLYISKDAITELFPDNTFVYESPLNDGVLYAKFTFSDLAADYLASIQSSMEMGPNVYPSFTDDTKSSDYLYGYDDGYQSGAEDGYVDDTNKTNYSLDDDQYVSDPINGKADFDTAYPIGYQQGFVDAQAEKVSDDASFAKTTEEVNSFAANESVDKLLEARQSISTKVMDQIINNFCKDLTLGIVQKNGDNKYSISLDTGKIFDTLSSIATYCISNQNNIAPTLTAIVNSFPSDELTTLGIDADTKQSLLDSIAQIPTNTSNDDIQVSIDSAKTAIDSIKDEADKDIQANYSYTLEKTGSKSYDTIDSLSIKSLNTDLIPFDYDIDFSNTLSINKDSSGDIDATPTVTANSPSNTSISLAITDPNAVGAGIEYSTSPDLTNPVNVAATKSADGSYISNIKGIAKNTTYYYKTYTIDAGNNLVYASDVKTFLTTSAIVSKSKATVSNPDTGDDNMFMLFTIFSIAILLMIAMPLLKRKKAATNQNN